ncbi:unnamed protein product [Adineta steineri]|uniref:MFS transporter n=1 Tax=Adineta steineri TaxID=433720 RepID=A0A819HC89_9BILA|nr:unnamed protein product [Adineta steineri]CAF3901324.1 unnamed protein product [Adineta steineri]
MRLQSNNQVRSQIPLWKCIFVVLVLYVLQGVTLGIADVISLYVASNGATWKQQSALTLIMYPFSLKLLWAPLIDVLYIRQLGRRQTWLLPIQIILGIMFIILSFYLEQLLTQLYITNLTIIFFFIILFIATQDICVDGWALTLFTTSNIVWQSISQMIGQPLGLFLGSSVLLTFESANATNKLIRQPFGFTQQPYGLFTLAQFLRFWGIMFLITTCVVTILFRKHHQDSTNNEQQNNHSQLNLLETYLYIIRLFKKRTFHKLLFLIMTPHFGYAATAAMTHLILLNQNILTRETYGLITMPLILIKITVPLLLSRIDRPLVFYGQTYMPRLILGLFVALFIYFASRLQSYSIIFYSLLIILFGLSDAFAYLQGTARGAFFAYITDKRIGSTYLTFLTSLHNLGGSLSGTLVLHTVSWLPKEHAYYIAVGVCFVIGCIWLCFSWKMMYQLQDLPVEHWHLKLHTQQDEEHGEQQYPMITAVNGRV